MDLDYSVKISKRSRRVRIAVLADGRVVVSTPKKIGEARIAGIVEDHRQWIMRAIDKCKRRVTKIAPAKETFVQMDFIRNVHGLVKDGYERIAKPFGARLGKISVKKMRSRWGSASRNGNISVNLILGHLPERLLEYVVLREVCHLVHHDHSKNFWSLLAANLPEHRSRKLELRRYGHLLVSNRPF
jgi:predicted metal-dependent hydrolase